MNNNQFDDMTDIYDALVDWPKRLGHEEPFYRSLFADVQARRILDVACGTGRHAAMFHEWGLSVEGADLSGKMIDQARSQFPESPTLHWAVRSFEDPLAPAEPFDVALCVGNSLALPADSAAVTRGIKTMLTALRPGGRMVLQVLNLAAMAEGPCKWQRSKQISWRGKEALVTKGIHRCGRRGFVEFILTLPAEAIQVPVPTISFMGLEADELKQAAMENGAARVEFFGGYLRQPYVRETSVDLLMIAERA